MDREQELALIFNNVTDLVGLMHVEGPDRIRVVTANDTYFSLTRKTREEVIGRLLQDWLPPEGYSLWMAKAREAFSTKKPVYFESRSYTTQPPLVLEQRWNAIFDGDGVCTHILVTARNVTELKQAQDRLRHAEKMEAVGQLAGGIAHDFNNLLTAINGFAHLTLVRKDLPPDLREFAEGVLKAGERAAALTSQLLAYGRKTVLLPRLLNLNAALSDMEKILRRLIPESIDLKLRHRADLGLVKVDPGQMSQIVLNLVVNARDAMPAGGELTLETDHAFLSPPSPAYPAYPENDDARAEAPAGAYVVLSVKDNGCGMKPAVRERIFEPYFTTKAGGTGLGLSSVYGIVRQSGGHISVHSEPDRGAEFRILLPMAESMREPDPGEAEKPHAWGERGSRETVLLVEDEDPVRAFVRKALELLGYSVKEARNPEEALRWLEPDSGAVDLLLTDMVMPGSTGVRLAERAEALRPGIPILFITGYAEQDMIGEALGRKDAAILHKPFSPSQLAAKVRERLDRAGGNQ